MSAFIVGRDMIDLLTTAAVDGGPHDRGLRVYHGGQHRHYTDGNDIGATLWAENVRSVNYRYNDMPDDMTWGYVFRRVSNLYGVGARHADVLNACACLRYQSCETPDYADTLAAAMLDAIERKVISSMIPDGSPWEWSREYQEGELAKVRAQVREDMAKAARSRD